MEEEKIKNIYEKVQIVKQKFLEKNIKKNGENKFANYSYYLLNDIMPNIIELCNDVKLFTGFSFDKELAELFIVNIENTTEQLKYTSPMEELALKGTNKIQSLGGVETYQRRYLLMAAFDIIENDMFDCTNKEVKPVAKEKAGKDLLDSIIKLSIETNTDPSELLSKYSVKYTKDMTLDQAMDCYEWLKGKLNG